MQEPVPLKSEPKTQQLWIQDLCGSCYKGSGSGSRQAAGHPVITTWVASQPPARCSGCGGRQPTESAAACRCSGRQWVERAAAQRQSGMGCSCRSADAVVYAAMEQTLVPQSSLHGALRLLTCMLVPPVAASQRPAERIGDAAAETDSCGGAGGWRRCRAGRRSVAGVGVRLCPAARRRGGGDVKRSRCSRF